MQGCLQIQGGCLDIALPCGSQKMELKVFGLIVSFLGVRPQLNGHKEK
jgi:hypothetical protein